MRFTLIDRVTQLTPGESITAVKNLSLAEEYLADHFPGFPVMPGVLMLEAMTQTAAWLVRVSEDFAHSVVMLKEARSVKYASFVKPAETLLVQAQLLEQGQHQSKLKAAGFIGDKQVVSARLTLQQSNLAGPDQEESDRWVVKNLKSLLAVLWAQAPVSPSPSVLTPAVSTPEIPVAGGSSASNGVAARSREVSS